jgi:hypothetical protein
MHLVAQGTHNDLVLPLSGTGKQFGKGVLNLRGGLGRTEAAFLAIDVRMGQVEVRRAHARERIDHPYSFLQILHHPPLC